MVQKLRNTVISIAVIILVVACLIAFFEMFSQQKINENLTSSIYELFSCEIKGIGFVFSSENSSPELRPTDPNVIDWVELHYYPLDGGPQFPLDKNGKPVLLVVKAEGFGQDVWDADLGKRVFDPTANGNDLKTIAMSGVVMYPNDEASLAANKAYFNISGAFLVSDTYMPIAGSNAYNQDFNPKLLPDLITPTMIQDVTCQYLVRHKDRSATTLSCGDAKYLTTANYLAIGPPDIENNGFVLQACHQNMQIILIKDAISELNRLRQESTDAGFWAKIENEMQTLKLFVDAIP